MPRRNYLLPVLVIAILSASAVAQTSIQPGQPGQGARKGRHMLKRFDANGDGQISRDEWKGKPQAFDRLDRDHNDVITADELAAARQMHRQRMVERLEKMDANRDGIISRQEWTGKLEVFDRLDQNHDGMLTREELQSGRHHRKR